MAANRLPKNYGPVRSTKIKLQQELYDKVARDARRRHVTISEVINDVLKARYSRGRKASTITESKDVTSTINKWLISATKEAERNV